jgi:hypothetical protein
MTRQRNDEHSTEYGLWLRIQDDLDSSLGFVTTNIDYVWKNYKTGQWMYMEEKRYMSKPTWSQSNIFKQMHANAVASGDEKYHGFHIVTFEKTNPEDGKIYLDGNEITKEQHKRFLKFEEV